MLENKKLRSFGKYWAKMLDEKSKLSDLEKSHVDEYIVLAKENCKPCVNHTKAHKNRQCFEMIRSRLYTQIDQALTEYKIQQDECTVLLERFARSGLTIQAQLGEQKRYYEQNM